MVKLATQLIDRQSERFHPTDLDDRYETPPARDHRRQGERPLSPRPPSGTKPERGNVVDLMAALKRSLGQTTAREAVAKVAKPSPVKKPVASKPAKAAPPARKPVSRKRA